MQLDTLDTATLNKLIQNKINFSIKTENRAAGIGVELFGNVGRLMSIYTAIGISIHNALNL
ncbi:hypothetical protein JL12_05665 [Gallibacterium anatis 10672-6]|uniref:hypothetical protein n=1 Tax=Gallibacterium anatis TaxID=750 RepID=UPI000531FF68|nr:hypothetical protein [Gallibacterium anatis]KGQ50403.1 hypothetical protein JL12_05665 [Gallibacterium anatis 10672-6]